MVYNCKNRRIRRKPKEGRGEPGESGITEIIVKSFKKWQQKRPRCIEQFFGFCGRGWGYDDLGEGHWNMYIIKKEKKKEVMHQYNEINSWNYQPRYLDKIFYSF